MMYSTSTIQKLNNHDKTSQFSGYFKAEAPLSQISKAHFVWFHLADKTRPPLRCLGKVGYGICHKDPKGDV